MSLDYTIKELDVESIEFIANYWLDSDAGFLEGMGVDLNKLPTKASFHKMLEHQLSLTIEERNAYCLIWYLNDEAIGHCNTNPTTFGDHAYMHLHIWKEEHRRKGHGKHFLALSISHFFEQLQIHTLYSQPFVENPAPNRTLQNIGFQLEEEVTIVPGSINFLQKVKKWKLEFEDWTTVNP